jgi:hypothetical protein
VRGQSQCIKRGALASAGLRSPAKVVEAALVFCPYGFDGSVPWRETGNAGKRAEKCHFVNL